MLASIFMFLFLFFVPSAKGASSSRLRAVVILLHPEGYLLPTVLAPHPQFIPRHHTATKKKTNDITSLEPPTSTENAIVPSANVGNNEDASVDHVAEGEFKVELHDLGISPKDIKGVRRIETCLTERSHNAW